MGEDGCRNPVRTNQSGWSLLARGRLHSPPDYPVPTQCQRPHSPAGDRDRLGICQGSAFSS